MKVLIDIDDKTYETIKNAEPLKWDCPIESAYKAIKNGTPLPKGHWIDNNESEIDARYGRHIYKCSECDRLADKFVCGTEDWWDSEKPNYCPNCGAKMESEE